MRVHDTLLAILFVAAAALMMGYTTTFPAFPGQKYGPSLFPRILGTGIILCALIIAFRARRNGGSHRLLVMDPVLRDPKKLWSFLAIPGAIALYLLTVNWLGFIPVCFGILLGLMLWFGVRTGWALAVAAVMTGLIHWFFGTLMRVPLPRGLFMQLLVGG